MWRTAIVIFAKTPQPGASKTRLCPPLGFDDAAELSRRFIRDTAATIGRVAASTPAESIVAPYVSYAGDAHAMRGLVGERFAFVAQRGSDFGERLRNTVADVFAGGVDAVAVIDSDSPTVPDHAYVAAVRSLERSRDRAAIGPCDDGGYYCLATTRFVPSLFEEIAWSTERVFAQTCARARAAGLAVDVLPQWYDVDDAASLAVLTRELRGESARTGAPAPATAAYLDLLVAAGSRTVGDVIAS